jgi:hypothetical protein
MRIVVYRDEVEKVLKGIISKAKEDKVELTEDEDYASSFAELVSHALDDEVFVSVIYLYRAIRCIDFLLEHECIEGDSEAFSARQRFLFEQKVRIKNLACHRLDDHS